MFATKKPKPSFLETEPLSEMLNSELSHGIFNVSTYQDFMSQILSRRNRALNHIYDIKQKGGRIAAIGAAARGNTILNFYNLDRSVVDFVTDVSPLKIGKFTPLTRIKIVPDDEFATGEEIYAIPLTDNLSSNLKKVLLELNPEIVFLEQFGLTR